MVSCSPASEAGPSPLPVPKVSSWEHEPCLVTNTSILATEELLLCYLFNKSGDWLLCRLVIRTHRETKRNSAFVQDVYFYQYNLLTESHSPLASQWQLHFSSWVGKRKLSEPAYAFDGFVKPGTILQCRENYRPYLCILLCIILYRYLMSLSEFSMSLCDSLMLINSPGVQTLPPLDK